MNKHALYSGLERAQMPAAGSILSIPTTGIMFGWGITVPADTTAGYAPGCLFIHTDGTTGSQLYINTGTVASCAFVALSASGGTITLADAANIVVNTTTGTKIGTSAAQKLGFYNATPVIQQASANQTAVTDSTGGSVADAVAAAVTTFTPEVAWNGSSTHPSAADATAIAAAITALTNGLAKCIKLCNAHRTALVALGLEKGSA